MDNRLIKHFVIIGLISVLLCSCKYAMIPEYVKKQQFNFSNRAYETKLNKATGYYKADTSYSTILIFFKENICAMGYIGATNTEIEENLKKIETNSNHYFYKGGSNFYWGTYSVSNDTLRVKIVNHPSLISPTWMVFEEWYIITKQNSLQLIAYRQIKNENPNNDFVILNNQTAKEKKFIEISSIPNYDKSWLLEKNWFWLKD